MLRGGNDARCQHNQEALTAVLMLGTSSRKAENANARAQQQNRANQHQREIEPAS